MGKWQISMDPVQEWGEEVEDDVVYGVALHRICEPDSDDVTDTEPAPEPRPLSCVKYRTLKVRRLKAATLQRLISELFEPHSNEPEFPRIFLSTYRAFSSTSSLIQLLFQREDKITNLDSSVCVRTPLPPLVRLWLDEFSEDFRDSPQHQALRLLLVHLRHRLCFRRLAIQAETLLHTLQEEDRRVDTEGSEVTGAPVLDGSGGEAGIRTETRSLLSFSSREIAEQLTRLDAALFVRVVPFHCLGCVWSQRDKKENRNLAPSVRATIAQFNSVTNTVITSLLCPRNSSSAPGSPQAPRSPRSPRCPRSPRSPRGGRFALCQATSPQQRAQIIEKWICVAQECHQLRNFSSLRAILSALQSNAVYRLKKTWAAVSRDSAAVFEQLCENFPDENCVLTSQEIVDESCGAGEVPYLGTYLTALTMLDTALPDTLEGGLINFEKRRREYEILSQIRVLQSSCSLYSFSSHPSISSWLISCTPLSDQQSYDLSRELEPPVDPCPNSPSFWSQRLITKKISSLLGGNDKAPVDQISVSSSGSSGSEMDDLCPLRHKTQSVSALNISTDSAHSSTSSSPQPDLSALSSDSASPTPSSSSSSSTSSFSSSSTPCPTHSSSSDPAPSLPHYNSKEICDSCIIRVSVEQDIGNVYKSIRVTSQDKASQVVQRSLSKHNLENLSSSDFSLVQKLPQHKELLMPDNANVFYAMCPSSYDFVLRQTWANPAKTGTCSSPAPPRRQEK
ncbi:ral guanine nucleotide dissociation stimulator-like 1 isoform X2 [Hoplias malabaricus]|uniref:ral guanine nucleotide dissociation stimulator-like 1 isoform X2 n=1 Tax=Hoplias malabaricus TaxID=27720 RepID=UPI0034627933